MKKRFLCVLCPNGCELTATLEGETVTAVEGNLCKNGETYARQEAVDPRRTVTSSVRVLGGELPLVSVRLTAPVPLGRVFDVMEQLRRLSVSAPVAMGQVLAANILGLGCDVIATKPVEAVSSGVRRN